MRSPAALRSTVSFRDTFRSVSLPAPRRSAPVPAPRRRSPSRWSSCFVLAALVALGGTGTAALGGTGTAALGGTGTAALGGTGTAALGGTGTVQAQVVDAQRGGAAVAQAWAGSSGPTLRPPSAELLPLDTPAQFATAVAVSGDTAAVTGLADGVATVYVFVRSASGWAEQAAIADPTAEPSASTASTASTAAAGSAPGATRAGAAGGFGSVLALSGDVLAITTDDGTPAGEGAPAAVDLYVRSAGAWTLQAHLQPPRAAGQGFGAALGLAGTTLVVGAPGTAGTAGAAYIYAQTAAGAWNRQAIVSGDTPQPGDGFGHTVTVAHHAVVVGGQAEIEMFELRGAAWQRTASFQGSAPGTDFDRVSAVSASNETVAVGDADRQRVSLFIHTSAGWFHQIDIDAPPGAAGFGSALAFSQDSLAVGAPATSLGYAAASGAVYVFSHRQRRWPLDGAFSPTAPAPGEAFGSAVALSIHTALVGSTGHGLVLQPAWLIEGIDVH